MFISTNEANMISNYEFSTTSIDFGIQRVGSVISIPEISAYINRTSCDVDFTVYYQTSNVLKEVELISNYFYIRYNYYFNYLFYK